MNNSDEKGDETVARDENLTEVIGSVGRTLALVAVGGYALSFLVAALSNLSGIIDAEVMALNSLLTHLFQMPAAAAAAVPSLTVIILIIVLCILAVLYLYFVIERWVQRIVTRLVTWSRCRWVGFWGILKCIWETFKIIVEVTVWFLVSFLAIVMVIVNIIAAVIVITTF